MQLFCGNQSSVPHFQDELAVHYIPASLQPHLSHCLDLIVHLSGGEGNLGQNGPLVGERIEQKLLVGLQVGGTHHGVQGDFHRVLPAHEANPQFQRGVHRPQPPLEGDLYRSGTAGVGAGEIFSPQAAAGISISGGLSDLFLIAQDGVRSGSPALHQVLRHLIPPHLPVELPVGAAVHDIVHGRVV